MTMEFDNEKEVQLNKDLDVLEEDSVKKEADAKENSEAATKKEDSATPTSAIQTDLFGEPLNPEELATGKVKRPSANINADSIARMQASKKKKEAEKDKTGAKKTASKPISVKSNTPSADETFGTDYEIYYAGNHDRVPEADMKIDKIREYMEVSYPELSKDRTRWEVDRDKKYLIPMVLGAKKG